MATKWENRASGLKDLEGAIKKYSATELKAQVDLFLKQYTVVAEAEEKLLNVLNSRSKPHLVPAPGATLCRRPAPSCGSARIP